MLLKIKVLDSLGKGLSVRTICERLDITYEDLCKLAQEDNQVYTELKRWYPKYDFLAEPKREDKPLKSKKKTQKTQEEATEEVVDG